MFSRAAPSGHDAGNRIAWARRRHRSGRAPPSTSGRALSSGAARHHRPSPNHRHAILPDHHQIARPATASAAAPHGPSEPPAPAAEDLAKLLRTRRRRRSRSLLGDCRLGGVKAGRDLAYQRDAITRAQLGQGASGGEGNQRRDLAFNAVCHSPCQVKDSEGLLARWALDPPRPRARPTSSTSAKQACRSLCEASRADHRQRVGAHTLAARRDQLTPGGSPGRRGHACHPALPPARARRRARSPKGSAAGSQRWPRRCRGGWARGRLPIRIRPGPGRWTLCGGTTR